MYHEPVLLKETIDALNIAPSGVYVDATFGGGGHSREILSRLGDGRVYAFDQDPDTAGNVFYRILRRMTPVDIRVDTGDFRLIDRKVVEQLRQMKERTRFVRGMVSWVGFKHCKLEYVREKRLAGETKYPFKKMLKFALDGILSFSQVPLKFASAFGFICSGISFLGLVYGLIIKYLFPQQAIPGWASIFVGLLFLGGVQLICLGVLGEYLGRIYEEVKQRPLYIADEEINFRQ